MPRDCPPHRGLFSSLKHSCPGRGNGKVLTGICTNPSIQQPQHVIWVSLDYPRRLSARSPPAQYVLTYLHSQELFPAYQFIYSPVRSLSALYFLPASAACSVGSCSTLSLLFFRAFRLLPSFAPFRDFSPSLLSRPFF